MRYFVERVCTVYNLLIFAQLSAYCYQLRAYLGDAQLGGECSSRYCTRVFETGHALHVSEDNREQERGDYNPPLHDGFGIEEFSLPARLRSLLCCSSLSVHSCWKE